MLDLLEQPNKSLKELFNFFKLNQTNFMQALALVRGNTRVTSDSPEATYDVLSKYAFIFDLRLFVFGKRYASWN